MGLTDELDLGSSSSSLLDEPPLPPAEDEGVGDGPLVEDTTSPLGFAVVTGGWLLLVGFEAVVTGAGDDDDVVTTTGGEAGLDVVLGSAGGSTLDVVTGAFVDVVSGIGSFTEVSMSTSAEELSSSALRARAPRFLW